ncbi:hypothetical protein [Mediterraneibacter agrestimuris]|uniref:hypothetical protein n=1 Tax=Mediterraneibacter agrestimuris TaxID=2941333 RepID=UPI00203FB0C5|nr:hypothetical protein [Mediterraneibacter agrestimuris]
MDRQQWEEMEKKKEYLNGYKAAKRREELILEQIQKLRSDAMMPSVNNDDMPHGNGGKSDLSDYIEKREELMVELQEERLAAVREYKKIYRSVKQIKDDEEREVLTRYYLMREKWDDIPQKIGYSRSKMFKVYECALKNFQIL